MSSYIAVLRFDQRSAKPAVIGGVELLLNQLRGVQAVDFDWPGRSLLVRFDRTAVSLGDIVRLLEDHGVAIAGVAQSRADVGSSAQTISA